MDYQNIFNRDFFPTPREVFDLMTQGEPLTDAVVLEHSAGSGNIVRYCKEQGARYVKACEINDTLRNSLYNECCVIGSDFLGVNREQVADVTHIIMNPPFSSVEKHILHAWEIAPDGCTLISLCPSSRFVSRYGDAKQLAEVIDLYGSREELGNVFNVPTADRRTNANISVIRLYKPCEKSQDFSEIEFDETPEGWEDMGTGEAGLIKYDALRDMVKRYNSALAQFDAVQAASERINADIRTFTTCRISFGAHGNDRENRQFSNITRERFRKELQHAAWSKIFGLLNMEKYTTSVLKEKIAKFVETSEAKPFNMRNIYLVVSAVVQNIGNIMDECIVKAFDTICSLSAENSTAGETWKTNSNYMINQKFIVDGMNCESHSGYEYKDGKRIDSRYLSYSIFCTWERRKNEMNDLYKALSFVCGKKINEAMYNPFENEVVKKCEDFGTWYQFDWFRVKFFKKGTMHFEFTDINVWYRFNQIAAKAKGWRIGSMTQCKTRKMWRDVAI